MALPTLALSDNPNQRKNSNEPPLLSTRPGLVDGYGRGPAAPNYTPMIAEDFSSGTVGNVYPASKSFPSTSTARYDDTFAFSGTKSAQIRVDLAGSQANPSFFGFNNTLPADVTAGGTVWFAAKIYAPSDFSWGYGTGGDAVEELKFMRLSNNANNSRIYLQPYRQQNNINLLSPPKIKLIAEANGAGAADFQTADAEFPRMEWFSVCFAVKVESDATGFMRAWVNDNYIGEAAGQTMPAGVPINEWAFGTNWNGGPYDNGSATPYFYVDEVIIASDVAGYGAPNTLDAGGRPYIHSAITVSDF